jgi:hypothetical protein
MEQSPVEKLTGPDVLKELPAFYGTGRFITAFTISVSAGSRKSQCLFFHLE